MPRLPPFSDNLAANPASRRIVQKLSYKQCVGNDTRQEDGPI
jgi:hypothetical protein